MQRTLRLILFFMLHVRYFVNCCSYFRQQKSRKNVEQLMPTAYWASQFLKSNASLPFWVKELNKIKFP